MHCGGGEWGRTRHALGMSHSVPCLGWLKPVLTLCAACTQVTLGDGRHLPTKSCTHGWGSPTCNDLSFLCYEPR